jgi:hypothetical protein
MSSYALVAALVGLCVAYLIVGRDRLREAPWGFALFALIATASWLIFVASATLGYLTPVFTHAVVSTIHTVTGEAAPRRLFGSAAGGAPFVERATGIASALLMALGFPFGLRAVWRQHRRDPLAVMLAVGGAGLFLTLALRFSPGAWEIANRASEFVFIGTGFVLAQAGLYRWAPRRAPWLGRGLTTACVAVIFAGGVITGWKPDLRLSQPYRIKAQSAVIESEPRQLARWTATHLGGGLGFAASGSDANLLAAYAHARAFSGRNPDVVDVLQTETLPEFELALLRENRLRYVALDRRFKSFDNMIGYYFGFRAGAGPPDGLYTPEIASKFDQIRADRIYDSGDIIVVDMGPGYGSATR